MELSKRVQKWSKELAERQEYQELSSIMVLKPKEKELTFNIKPNVGIYPTIPEDSRTYNTRKMPKKEATQVMGMMKKYPTSKG